MKAVTLTEEETEAFDHYVDAMPEHTTAACPYPMRAVCRHKEILHEMAEKVREADHVVAAGGRTLKDRRGVV